VHKSRVRLPMYWHTTTSRDGEIDNQVVGTVYPYVEWKESRRAGDHDRRE
jgi:hypothetical protein